ncbi:roadblock/LC7 domain-containing protein [Streptomyces sp. NPDC048172]|uniref:roadblock/LC7 domain-containing protein n=1 Tax=Streptomyces sp. NPDC048172 TaxID=3365505 RepID=UPI0037181C28
MNAPTTHTTSSSEARNLRWLLDNLVDEVPGVRSVAVVSSDGLLLLSSDPEQEGRGVGAPEETHDRPARPVQTAPPVRTPSPSPSPGPGGPGGFGGPGGPRGSSADLATIVSGVGSLTVGAAKLMDGGPVRQTMISMDDGALFVMTIGDGSLLGVHAAPDCDMSVIGYHMALFVGRAGHVLTPELRSELRESMELEQ